MISLSLDSAQEALDRKGSETLVQRPLGQQLQQQSHEDVTDEQLLQQHSAFKRCNSWAGQHRKVVIAIVIVVVMGLFVAIWGISTVTPPVRWLSEFLFASVSCVSPQGSRLLRSN